MTMDKIVPPPLAKKSLGQHFLHDANACQKIVSLLECKPTDKLVEIGPGPGALTHLLEREPHSHLYLLEKDRYWAAVRQREGASRTQTLLMDALTFDWVRINCKDQWKIVGNLPYNVASPLIWDIVACAQFSRAVFMVQKEVGQRLVAQRATKTYGALSVWVQNHAHPRLQFCVGPGAFNPPPAVDSAVLTFEPESSKPEHPQALAKLIHICFQQRRKQLGGILRKASLPNGPEALERCNIPLTARPEELTPYQFRELASALFCC